MNQLMKDLAYSANQIPGAGGAPGMVKAITEAFCILELRIKQLSIQLMIEKANMEIMTDRMKTLEDKPSCCREETSGLALAPETLKGPTTTSVVEKSVLTEQDPTQEALSLSAESGPTTEVGDTEKVEKSESTKSKSPKLNGTDV